MGYKWRTGNKRRNRNWKVIRGSREGGDKGVWEGYRGLGGDRESEGREWQGRDLLN